MTDLHLEDKKDDYVKVEKMLVSERDKFYSDILQEYDTYSAQKDKRIELLKKIETINVPKGKSSGVIAFIADETSPASGIGPRDIPAFGDALMHLGHIDILRLIINSPGGDGVTAEKLVDMCRSYCKKFEVIIPNMAKSAATMITLGADSIMMGYCSEIGPIDAQVPIVIDGISRYISAQSFINARKKLLKEFDDAVAQKKDVRAILQQIAGLNAPFIDQCEKYMQFGRDMVGKSLTKYMFKQDVKNPTNLKAKIDKVLSDLSSTETFIVHGRMINAHVAKTDLGLNVIPLAKDSPLWKTVWEFYVRADIGLGGRFGTKRASKMIETKHGLLMAG